MVKPALQSESVLFQKIDSGHYKGPSYGGMLSNLLSPNDNSYGTDGEMFPISVGFNNPCTAKTMKGLMAFDDKPHLAGDYAIFTTSQNKIAVSKDNYQKFGPVFNADDLNIEAWKATTEQNQSASYGPRPMFKGITMMRDETETSFPGKYITKGTYSGPMNDFGNYLSQAYNIKANARKFESSKLGKAMEEMYGPGEKITKFGVHPNKNVVNAIGRLKHGEIKLYNGINSAKEIAKLADHYKVHVNAMTNIILGEEYMHLYRKSFDKGGSTKDRVNEEVATKQALLEFCEYMVENSRDSATRQHYFRLARHIKRDRDTTPERYGKAYSAKRANLESKLEAEAEELGLEGEEASNYVAAKVREQENKNEASDLEEIVEEAEEATNENYQSEEKSNENYEAVNDNEEASDNEAECSEAQSEAV